MLGLTKLYHLADPETTFDKFLFLLKNAFTNAHVPTTTISISALASLIALRFIKNRFKNTWWIYRIPEVLVVVVVSIGMLFNKLLCKISPNIFSVLSSEFRWETDGVDILGAVDIHSGNSFIEFPLKPSNLKFLRRTTSTAV